MWPPKSIYEFQKRQPEAAKEKKGLHRLQQQS